MKVRITKVSFERAIHQSVYIRKDHTKSLILKYFLIGKTCIAPYILPCLFLYTASELREGLDLIERVASREGHVRKLIGLDDIQNVLDIHLASPLEVP